MGMVGVESKVLASACRDNGVGIFEPTLVSSSHGRRGGIGRSRTLRVFSVHLRGVERVRLRLPPCVQRFNVHALHGHFARALDSRTNSFIPSRAICNAFKLHEPPEGRMDDGDLKEYVACGVRVPTISTDQACLAKLSLQFPADNPGEDTVRAAATTVLWLSSFRRSCSLGPF